MNKEPLVSVIIPTKNSSKTLEACLLSVKNQTYKNIEIVLVDNSSTDATTEISKKYTNLVFTKGPERSVQRNYGVGKSNGYYVFIIDSDMELSKTVIEECVEAFNSVSVSGVVVSEVSFGEGFWSKCKALERSFYVGVPWIEAARFFKKSQYVDIGGYDESMISGEDWYLSQKFEKIGAIKRISSYLKHNEGRLNLFSTLKKKYYYAKHFKKYLNQSKSVSSKNQTSIVKRYWLFFSKPGKLFRNPVLGFGMLFMKTCEFAVGGYVYVFL